MNKKIKYLEIASKIKSRILSDIYKKNSQLPSEKELGQQFSTSRLTIREALNCLSEDGYVYTLPGKGTFVSDFSRFDYIINLDLENIITCGFDGYKLTETKIIDADIYTVYYLQIAPENKVVLISGILYKDNQVLAYDERYIPYFKKIPIDQDSLNFTSFKELFQKSFNVFEIHQSINIRGIYTNPKLNDIFGYFDTNPRPCVLIEKSVYDHEDKPLGYNKLYVHHDYCEISGESIK